MSRIKQQVKDTLTPLKKKIYLPLDIEKIEEKTNNLLKEFANKGIIVYPSNMQDNSVIEISIKYETLPNGSVNKPSIMIELILE